MKKYEIEVMGVAPLLQHKFRCEEHGTNKERGKVKEYDPVEEAEKVIFRSKDGKVVHPSEHLMGAISKAAVSFTFEGKKSYKDMVKSNVNIEPFDIPLLDAEGKQYTTWDEIDTRRVVIGRAGVVRWRPSFYEGWKLKFIVSVDDDRNLGAKTLKDIIEKAGTIGIGDYRPRFGRFMVTSFKEDGSIPKK